MSVVSAAHFALIRARRELQKAFQEQDWQALRSWDKKLGECLNNAFDDAERDTLALVEEMETVLKLYAEIVAQLPEQSVNEYSFPLPNRVTIDDNHR